MKPRRHTTVGRLISIPLACRCPDSILRSISRRPLQFQFFSKALEWSCYLRRARTDLLQFDVHHPAHLLQPHSAQSRTREASSVSKHSQVFEEQLS